MTTKRDDMSRRLFRYADMYLMDDEEGTYALPMLRAAIDLLIEQEQRIENLEALVLHEREQKGKLK